MASRTGHRLHNETVRDLLDRYFWRHPDFHQHIRYPAPDDPLERRLQMVRLHEQGLTEKTIAVLLRSTPRTVYQGQSYI